MLGIGPQQFQGCGRVRAEKHGFLRYYLCLARGHHGCAVAPAARLPPAPDRLFPFGRPQDLGCRAAAPRAERRRSLGSVPVLRRPAEVRLQGAGHSGGRQQGRLPAGAAGRRYAGSRHLGGGAAECGLGDRQYQCRHSLCLCHLLAGGLWHHHGRLGIELQISVPRRAPLGSADGVLRSLDRLRDRYRPALRRLAEPDGYRHGAARRPRHPARPARILPGLALAVALPDVHRLLHLGAGRDEPPALRPSGSGIGTGGRLHGGIWLHPLHDVHAGRILGHRADVRAHHHPLPGWLAAAGRCVVPELGSRYRLVPDQGIARLLHVRHGQGLRAALPL